MPEKLILIDGHSLAFRAFHALPLEMATRSGELTSAVYGFTSMLLNVLRDEKPDYIAVAFDVGKTFRHERYEAYKGHRLRTPEELEAQIERIKQVVEAFNIPIYTREGYEADDVLATLARQAEAKGVDTLIVTGDTDILQVVDDHIHVLTSRRSFSDTVRYDPAAVEARYGLPPEKLLDYKGLIGDKSDNIPGVPGIGAKTAVRLLQQYADLEDIYTHLDEITPPRARKALAEHKETAFLSRELATIITDIEGLDLDLEACRTRNYDRDRVLQLFRELEFRSLAKRLPEPRHPTPAAPADQLPLFEIEAVTPSAAPIAVPPPKENPYLVVRTPKELTDLVARLQATHRFAFDTETTSTDAMQADLVGISVAWDQGPGNAAYVPLAHRTEDASPQLPWPQVREALALVFADERVTKVAHNVKYDLTMLRRYGLDATGPLMDTMIAEWLIDPASRNLGLKALAWSRLGVEMTEISSLIGQGKDQITMDQVQVGLVAPYAAADVDMTLRLVDALLPELESRGLVHLFRDVEMPLVPVLTDMEMTGILLDVDFLRELSARLTTRLQQIEGQIYELVGYRFNINSTQQLSDVLFGTLGLSPKGVRKTKSGHYSTSASVLESLQGQHEVVDLILEQRQLQKLLSTYIDALPTLVNPKTGRVHTSFNQTGAETGRLSSSNPNLQNIPIRTDVGREIRKAFVARPGWLLLAADYSQVELRILAHVSQDEAMLRAFAEGKDIHTATAAAVFGIPMEQVTPTQRRVAKMMNFATSYGVSAYGLASRTGLSRTEAAQFLETYFRTYPKVKQYLEETKRKARELGYVETLLGRRRYFPILQTADRRHYNERMAAERAAINHPIQGTAADIIKIAMVQLYQALKERGYQAAMLLQVHDELVLEAPKEELDEVAALTRDIMEGAYKLDAPLKVDVEVGPNWYEMEGISEHLHLRYAPA
ncbi:MAG TPA: DNA polymerase I [Anaerolineae bacterium]|nr:DNA polymerase I [Anaerolineae bacterium]